MKGTLRIFSFILSMRAWWSVLLCCFVVAVQCNNITAYAGLVDTIFTGALNDEVGYQRLGEMCNTFGSRLSGSESLEQAIDWTVQQLKTDGFDSVTTEDVSVPNVGKFSRKHSNTPNQNF